jgi:TrmH family RNA methyltransferase
VKEISSVQNPIIKELLQLKEKSRNRRKSGRFLIEGVKEVRMALLGGYQIEMLLYCPDLLDREILDQWGDASSWDQVSVSQRVYEKLALRGSTEGVLAVAQARSTSLADLDLKSENPLVLVAESPEKPGNIGALMRTADAAGVDAVIIADPETDIYNPNVVRSSVGCLFTLNVAVGSTDEVIRFLNQKKIDVYSAALSGSVSYDNVDMRGPTALVVGTESTGLTSAWLDAAAARVRIPMMGKIDSLNVSVSAAILLYEAVRQRKQEN